jgi:hypothetical protein
VNKNPKRMPNEAVVSYIRLLSRNLIGGVGPPQPVTRTGLPTYIYIIPQLFLVAIIHSCRPKQAMRCHSNQDVITEIDVPGFIGIPRMPLVYSCHVKPSHWSFVHAICMLRESGISHIKFLREGGRVVDKGGACRGFIREFPVVGLYVWCC